MAASLLQQVRCCLPLTTTTRHLTTNSRSSLSLQSQQGFSKILFKSTGTITSRRWQAQHRSIFTANAARETLPQTDRTAPPSEPLSDITRGFNDEPAPLDPNKQQDWATSFHGLSSEPFAKEVSDTLLTPLSPDDIEVKPDGIIYLPEIKYRRILNRAFGPGGWGLAPRGETIVTPKAVTREYALVALGRLVSVARGEQDYFSPEGIPTAAEGCKSNALTRCCKDLGIASELWDPRFIRKFLTESTKAMWVEHTVTKKKKKIYLRKDDKVGYPWKETKMPAPNNSGTFN